MIDAIVIGAGPSGAHFAYEASKKGYSVTLIDSKSLGRFKCCAGALSGRFLEDYKIPEEIIERKITSVVLKSPIGETAELDFKKQVSATVNRAHFDRWLVERAVDSGADVLLGSGVKDVLLKDDFAEVKLANGHAYHSKLLIGAFGMSPEMFRVLRIQMPRFIVGLQAEIPLPQEQIDKSIGNSLELHFNPKYSIHGYAYVFPKKQYVSIGLITHPANNQKRENLWNFIVDYSVAKNIRKFVPWSFEKFSSCSALIPNKPLNITCGDCYMLIGDAAGLVDPTSWEGLFFDFRSAELAVEALDENYDKSDFSHRALSAYQDKWTRLFGKDLADARKIQGRVYGKNMGKLWTLIISELNKSKSFKTAVMEQMAKDMSVAKMARKIPLSSKLRLISRNLS